MSSPKAPSPPSPEQAAQAAVMATQAGDIYQVANAPVQGYADLYTQAMLGPARAQLQQGLANQAALQSALAQKDIQSRVDPQAYAMRQMNLNVAQSRLGQLYSMDPTAFSYRNPAAYATPTAAALPSLRDLSTFGGVPIAQNLSSIYFQGGQPQLAGPAGSGSTRIAGTGGPTSQVPSYLGV